MSTNPVVTLATSLGEITLELRPDKAPKTVENFLTLARKGYYDGLTFHRCIPDFMIQGGCPKGDGTGGPGYAFDDEISDLHFDKVGLLAMANSGTRGGKGTNGSQSFITVAPTTWLDGKHTIFGIVTRGYDIVEKASRVPTSASGNRPSTPITITKVSVAE